LAPSASPPATKIIKSEKIKSPLLLLLLLPLLLLLLHF
jgi:hypothetical protein